MIKRLKANPILLQQMRNAGWPSIRTAWLIAAGLTVIGLALIIGIYAYSPDGKSYMSLTPFFVMLFIIILMVCGPLFTAMVAVSGTIELINSENYQTIYLGQLSEHGIVIAHAVSSLFQLRLMWVIAGGSFLPLIAALTYAAVRMRAFIVCELIEPTPPNCIPPSPSDMLIPGAATSLILTLYCAMLFVTWNFLAATDSVWMVYRHRRNGLAFVGTLALLLLVMMLQIGAFLVFSFVGLWNWPVPLLLAVLVSVAVNVVLGLAAYYQAVKHVRSTTE